MTEPWKKYQSGANTAQADGPWAKYAPPPERSVGEEITRQLGLTGRYMLEGASTPVAIIGNAANGVANLGIGAVNALAGTNIPKFTTYEKYRDTALEKAGLPQPENAKERVIGDMSRFVSGIGPSAGIAKVGEMAGTKALAPLAENMAGQAIAAETAGGAYGVAKEHTDNPWLQALAALGGAAVGGAGFAAADRMLPSNNIKPPVPSTQQIGDMSRAAYQDAREAGAIIDPKPLQKVGQEFTDWLANFGYDPALQPKVAVLLNRIGSAGEQPITAEGVDIIRKVALNVAKDGNPSERAIAGDLIGRLDDMMTSLTPDDVVQGSADDAVQAFTKARDLWKTFRKSELIDNLQVKAEDQAMSTNSGGNVQNVIRQKLRSILDNPKQARMFSQEEQDAIRQIVRGTATQNTLRVIGRLAPSSNSWLMPILASMGGGAGYAAGGVPGVAAAAAVPALGSAAKAGATALTKNAVNSLSEMIRSGAIQSGGPAMEAPSVQDLMIQSLMQGTRPLPANAYADALLRFGGAAVPASVPQNRGSQNRP